ncbi:acyl-CoA synthetase [Nakamurella sp.]|uniref:acyl-CoA synthetase n=1 Tax=Nakamurella sp. TaxID=1869182 RepID=UPI003B3AF3B9
MRNKGTGTWIHRRRVKSAGAPALTVGESAITYDALADRIDRLANALAAGGVGHGDRVAYLGENHPAFVETFFAAGTLGAIFVPLNTRLAPPEVAFVLCDSGATVLIHSAELTELATIGSDGTEVRRRIVADGPVDAAGPAEHLEAVIAAAAPEHPDVEVDLPDPAMIQYTSGTTGHPKGAVISHQNIAWNSYNVLIDYELSATSVALMISPMFHAAALGMGVLPMLLKGANVVLESHFDAGRVLELIPRYRVTALSGVPTTYQLICEHPAWPAADLSSVRMLTCGGSAVPTRVLDAYEQRGLSFTGGYGMTETSPGATSLPSTFSRFKAGSAGLAHFFTDVRVADDAGRDLPAGQSGEVQIQGPNVFAGYWQRSDATAESFTADGWFRSGDIGYRDESGFLFIADRLKDMIISGGENIYPAEIEQVILEIEAVAGVAVVGVPDEKWGEVPRAYVQLRPGHSVTKDEVVEHLSGRLARYKIPKTVVVLDELPRTSSGKIRKRDLRTLAGSGAAG